MHNFSPFSVNIFTLYTILGVENFVFGWLNLHHFRPFFILFFFFFFFKDIGYRLKDTPTSSKYLGGSAPKPPGSLAYVLHLFI